MMFYLLVDSLPSLLDNLENSVREGVQWGNSVAIAVTATLLAISLISFLYNKSN